MTRGDFGRLASTNRTGSNLMNREATKTIRKNRGVTSIEYALLAALIAVVIVGAVGSTGSENGGLWTGWTNKAVAAFNSTGS